MEQTNNAPSYRKEQLQSFAGQNSPFGIPSGNIKAQVPEQSGPLVQKKRSSLIPKINLGGIFSLGPKSTKPNSAANVGNNSGNPSLTPPNNSNGDQDEVAMFFNFLAGITELPVCREYDAEMDLPVEQRDHFKFNPEDSETAKKMFKGVLALFFQTYFHQLDPTKVDSLEKLLNFEKNDLPRSVSVKRGLKVDYIFPEDMKRVYEMVHTSFKNITTAEEAEKLVEEINKKNKPFLEKVGEDECRMNFPTPWINIAGEYLAALANKDILPCLEKATVKTPPKDFMKYFNLLIAGRDIVKRKWLAVDVRLDLLEKMKPVIEGFIDYSLAIPSSRTREVNQLRGTALDIQSEFNEPLDMFIPLKPKAETLPGDTSKPTDAPENGGKPGANAEQTNNEGKDGAGTETTPTSTNEKALDSEATSENDANSAAEPGSKEPTADQIPSEQVALPELGNTGSATAAVVDSLKATNTASAQAQNASSSASQNDNKTHEGLINPSSGTRILVSTTAHYVPEPVAPLDRPKMHVVGVAGPSDRVKGLTTKSPWGELIGNDGDSASDLVVKDFLLNSKIAEEAQEGKDTRPDTMKNLESHDQMKKSYAESKTA